MNIEQSYANYLDKDGIAAIQSLEKDTGTLIMAYNTPSVPAELSAHQLKKIEELEKKLCVRLVAFKTH